MWPPAETKKEKCYDSDCPCIHGENVHGDRKTLKERAQIKAREAGCSCGDCLAYHERNMAVEDRLNGY